MNEKKICAYCGEEHDVNAMTEIRGDWVCYDCRDEWFFQCDNCGEWHDADYAVSINRGEEYWCEECADNYAYQCDDCGEYFTDDRLVSTNDPALCYSCYGSGRWVSCADCGDIIHEDDAYWSDRDEEYYCRDCIDDHRYDEDDDIIHEYGYKPEPEIRRRKGEADTELTFGVELEVDKGDCATDTAEDVTDAGEGRVYCKRDGSLDSGFEIVSHPGTLAHHMYEMHWSNISRICRKAGFKSHDTTTCGLHVHVGRAQLGEDFGAQYDAIANAIILVSSLRESIVPFTRRQEYALSRWAALPTLDMTLPADELRQQAMQTRYNGRYQAINLQNDATIEFRIFKGTLNRDTLIASLQLVSNLCKYAMTHTTEECVGATFADIVAFQPYKELVAYSIKRDLLPEMCLPA